MDGPPRPGPSPSEPPGIDPDLVVPDEGDAFVPAQHIPRPADWRPGDPGDWEVSDAADRLALDGLRRIIGGRVGRRSELAAPDARESAVLVALVDTDAGPGFVLTRRSWELRHHRGEVSFPGGGRDPGDADLVATALREAHEEVGIDPRDVEVIGELDHLITVSSDRFIVPVVGVVHRLRGLRAQTSEVDEIRVVAAVDLLRPGAHREEIWQRSVGDRLVEHPVNFFDLPPDVVWGATAAMLRQLFDLVLGSAASSG